MCVCVSHIQEIFSYSAVFHSKVLLPRILLAAKHSVVILIKKSSNNWPIFFFSIIILWTTAVSISAAHGSSAANRQDTVEGVYHLAGKLKPAPVALQLLILPLPVPAAPCFIAPRQYLKTRRQSLFKKKRQFLDIFFDECREISFHFLSRLHNKSQLVFKPVRCF